MLKLFGLVSLFASRNALFSGPITKYHSLYSMGYASSELMRRLLSRPTMTPSSQHGPVHLIFDWDGTLTQKDTLNLVADIGYKRQNWSEHGSMAIENEHVEHSLPPWSAFGKAYMEDFANHEASYKPRRENRTALEQERYWLKSLEEVEVQSAKRVQEAGLFRGVTRTDISEAASNAVKDGKLQLRHGWSELFSRYIPWSSQTSTPNQISILSVNWSAHFIRSAMLAAARSPQSGLSMADQARVEDYVENHMIIHANEIYENEKPDGSKGQLIRGLGQDVRISADKLSRLPTRCIKNLDTGSEDLHTDGEALVVYFGDSTTDLECLLAADVGFCVAESASELAETTQRLGLSDHLHWTNDFLGPISLLEGVAQSACTRSGMH